MPELSSPPIRSLQDLGEAVRLLRQRDGLKTVRIAEQSGRSRDLLHRLEAGRDVTTSALLDILQAMGCALRIEKAGLPTLQEMRQRFALDDEDTPD